MMDRNLGATSATPGDVEALGLLYQWGRKDPFLGSSSIRLAFFAESTITWPSPVSSDSSNGTIAYATAHPTTFINSSNYDWYYTGSSSIDDTRWTTSSEAKSIYDPCPAGWRVPDGGSDGVWSKAVAQYKYLSGWLEDYDNRGVDFSCGRTPFGSASPIWYPYAGRINNNRRDFSRLECVGGNLFYWSASPDGNRAYDLFSDGTVDLLSSISRGYGMSVRCQKE